MQLPEQTFQIDLPTLLVDSRNHSVAAGYPVLEAWGYQAVEGKGSVGFCLDCDPDDPTRLQLSFRFLSAHYEPPADCHPETLQMIHRLNAELSDRLLGAPTPRAA